jgi:hypothetical protein
MTDPAFYREEAERCRQLAALSPGTAASKRWRALADEYLQLALASDERVRNAAKPPGPATAPERYRAAPDTSGTADGSAAAMHPDPSTPQAPRAG